MSIFTDAQIPCPACQGHVPFKLVDSVNATRELTQPGLKASILDRTFQKEKCPGCGEDFRIEPQFSYVDFRQKQFIGVWSTDKVDECSQYEARTLEVFERAYGNQASSEARDLGRGLKPRVVFGWNSLNEKLIAGDANVDDVTLELVKLSLIRTGDVLMDSEHQEFCLLGVEDESELVFGWFSSGSPKLNEVVRVSMDILQEIESEPEAWQELREDLVDGLFVDYRKLFLATEATA